MNGLRLALVVGVLFAVASAEAAEKSKAAAKAKKVVVGSKDGKESTGGKGAPKGAESDTVPGHPNLKIRQGSFLRKNEGEPETVDLRGELERQRDVEMRRHYTRMAQLDAIAEVAGAKKDGALIERVDAVRRKEERRFWAVMQELKGLAWQKIVRGDP